MSDPGQSAPQSPINIGWTRRWVIRRIASFLLLGGIPCLLFPLAQLFMPRGPALWPDTLAYFGAGTSEGVPTVSQVHCSAERYGTSRTSAGGNTDWKCTLFLAGAPATPQPANPYAGMTKEQAQAEYDRLNAEFYRGIAAQTDPARQALAIPDRIERHLSANRDGQIPALRRLSAVGEPPVFGVVWDGSELFDRWFHWAIYAVFFWAMGGACVAVGILGWKRTRLRAGG
jgi:hypothetical protein